MSDKEKGLPIRTQEDPDKKVQTKIVDFQDPEGVDKQLEVTDGNAHVEVHGNRADDGADVVLQLSEEGRVNPRGDYQVDDNSKPASSAPIMHQRKNTGETPTEIDQVLRPTGVTYDNGDDETIVAQDVAIRDENGVPFSKDNPLPVAIEESEGEEIQDYFEHVDVTSGNGTSQRDFVINDGETFLLDQVLCDGSLSHKMTLQVGDGAASETFATKAVRFASEAHDNADAEFKRPIKVIGTVNGTTIRIVVENRDEMDDASIYTTLVGLRN